MVATCPSTTRTICRGQTFPLTYTVMNNAATDAINVGLRIFINNSPSPSGYTGGWDMFSGTAPANHYGFFTETRTLTVPNVPNNGTYWIYWDVDKDNVFPEYNESDNAVYCA